jgi:TetR/AcrR family transcriptional repressor of nem operon
MPIETKDMRERILEAGAAVVTAKGFNGAGLTEILKRAGVPKGSFYHYFGSKEDFGVALIERASEEHLEWTRSIVGDRRRSPIERLRAVFQEGYDECVAQEEGQECLIAKLALETSKLSEPVHAAVKCAYQQWASLLAQVIREGQAAGEIPRSEDADRLASVLLMLWEGATIRREIERSPKPLDDFLHFVFDRLLRTSE